MNDILDLDALAPQPQKVKINGKVIDVYPPKMNQLLSLARFLMSVEKLPPDKQGEAIEKIREVLQEIVPEIDGLDLYVPQLLRLIQFIVSDTGVETQGDAKKGGESQS